MATKYQLIDKIDLMLTASGDTYVSKNAVDTKNFIVSNPEGKEATLIVSGIAAIERISHLRMNVVYTFRRLSQSIVEGEEELEAVYMYNRGSMLQGA